MSDSNPILDSLQIEQDGCSEVREFSVKIRYPTTSLEEIRSDAVAFKEEISPPITSFYNIHRDVSLNQQGPLYSHESEWCVNSHTLTIEIETTEDDFRSVLNEVILGQ